MGLLFHARVEIYEVLGSVMWSASIRDDSELGDRACLDSIRGRSARSDGTDAHVAVYNSLSEILAVLAAGRVSKE